MAINKKLIHFRTKASFDKEKEAGNILDTSIVFIQDANLIYTHGTFYANSYTKEELNEMLDNNYLSKTNTKEYVPTEQYHPATKDYVDKLITDVATIIELNKEVMDLNSDSSSDQIIAAFDSIEAYNELITNITTQERIFNGVLYIDKEKAGNINANIIATNNGDTLTITYIYNKVYSIITISKNSNVFSCTREDIKLGYSLSDEVLISNGVEPSKGEKIWIDLSDEQTPAPSIIGTIFKDSDGANALEQNGGTDTSWIKGKRCLVKKTSSGVAICYLDENNSELFHDGTTAASLDGSMGQWMTDVPEYYFNVDESTSGVHALQVSQFQQDGWKQSRRVLVGVTEAVNVSNKLWSKKGGQSTGSLTSVVFHNYATALGSGFDIIDYETHCKIAHLFYAKYANRNPQEMSQFGYGENSYTRTIGTTSSLGNNDGKTSTQISFLGIEDFYGGKYEWMSGIHSNGSIYYIYDGFEPDAVPTASYRTVDVGGSGRSGYISKVYWGEHGDMIPTEVSASSTTHYCDWGSVAVSGWHVAVRSDGSANDTGGVACCNADDSGNSYADIGSRIQYRGSIQVIEDPAEFKSLPVGF